jgi:hypothetical protein
MLPEEAQATAGFHLIPRKSRTGNPRRERVVAANTRKVYVRPA